MDKMAFAIKNQLAGATLSYLIARPDLTLDEVSEQVLAIYLEIFDQSVLTAKIRKVANESKLSAEELIALVRDK